MFNFQKGCYFSYCCRPSSSIPFIMEQAEFKFWKGNSLWVRVWTFSEGSAKFFNPFFFFITVVFMIFDVEIALLLPLVVATPGVNYMIWVFNMMVFLLILTLTLGTLFLNGSKGRWIEKS